MIRLYSVYNMPMGANSSNAQQPAWPIAGRCPVRNIQDNNTKTSYYMPIAQQIIHALSYLLAFDLF